MSSSFGYFGFQPRSRMAFSADATSRGGSPGRRGFFHREDFLTSDFFAGLDDLLDEKGHDNRPP
jgi:hypothetical protein